MRPRAQRRRPSLRLVLGCLAAVGIVIPLCLAGLVRLGLSATGSAQPFLRFGEANREIARATRLGAEGRLELVPGYAPPDGFELVVADEGGSVVMSTVPLFALGSNIDIASATTAARKEFASPYFFAEPLTYKDRVVGYYYAWLLKSTLRTEPSLSASVRASLALASVVSLFFLIGVFVATQLARAVLRLERAAGRIAAGDFETPVSQRGIREIEDLAAAMDGMRAALREDRDRRARFLAAVSHDLRTPLTSIGGYLEAVEDGLASDPRILERYVGIMRGKTRLLEARIAGLIEFARMETGEWRMGFETMELGPFLEGLCREFREDAALMDRGFSFELSALSGLSVAVDKALLTRAFENLVSNAIRYSPAGGSIRMEARRAAEEGISGAFVIDLDDEGPGIAPSERARVFEPFVRGSASREGEGNGLGLYIALSVIKGHGWDIRADGAPGGGGRFTIVIPRMARPLDRPSFTP
jgi:signal transduction histidine kinase